MKTCSKCRESSPLGNFYRNKRNKGGYQNYCKKCATESRKITREQRRKYNLKALYGMTQEEYDIILESQGHVCDICHTTEPGGRYNTWHVDHNHSTGKIRGLLCHNCNLMLGNALDSVTTLESGAKYLLKHYG